MILDPACGSGIQLAAYCAMLSREGLGIEMDDPTAMAANSNLEELQNTDSGNHFAIFWIQSVMELLAIQSKNLLCSISTQQGLEIQELMV